MAVEVHRLQLVAGSSGLDRLQIDLNVTAQNAGRAERATLGVRDSIKGLIAPVLGLVSAMGGLEKLVEVNREFGILQAGLETATGSAENAQMAFSAIQDFAATTPYDLAQATKAFTQLVNLGLTPSEQALRAYGNTASSMGKSLDQMVEAVADAATGEFERLKEFGIKASKQGDEVKFTFRGTTETVKNNSEAIESYLIKLGENNFAGAMEKRMKTLDGAISNLGDTWDSVFFNIGQAGATNLMIEGIQDVTSVLSELNSMISSGELEGYIEAVGLSFQGWGSDVKAVVDDVNQVIENAFHYWATDGKSTVDFITDAFKEMPQNIRAFIQLAITDIAYMADVAGSYGHKIANALNPFSPSYNLQASLDASASAYRTSIESILDERDKATADAKNRVSKAKNDRELDDLLRDWMKNEGASGDRLGKFGVKKDGGAPGQSAADQKLAKQRQHDLDELKKYLSSEEDTIQESFNRRLAIIEANTKKGSDAQARMIEQLKAKRDQELEKTDLSQLLNGWLKDQELAEYEYKAGLDDLLDTWIADTARAEEAINDRLDSIRRNPAIDAIREYQQLIQGQADAGAVGARIGASAVSQLDQFTGYGYANDQVGQQQAQIQAENDLYQQRLAANTAFLDAKAITEDQYRLRNEDAARQHEDRLRAIQQASVNKQLGGAASLFGGLADLAKAGAGEQSKTYQGLFAVSKAFTVASSIMHIQAAIAKAADNPFPENLLAMGTIASETAGIISTIKGTTMQVAGAFDRGGYIPDGKVGLVGEYGPELVSGPSYVTGRKRTADAIQGGGKVSVVVNNYAGADVETRESAQPDGSKMIEVIVRKAKEAVAQDIRDGGGVVSRSMEQSYGVRRGVNAR